MRKVLVLLWLVVLVPSAFAAPFKRPKLVLTLVIDQFRADYLMRFENRFLPARSGQDVGGFRYLMDHGAYFPVGEYSLLQSETGPGHATILSGSYPYLNGIPQNNWYDPTQAKVVYCVEDTEAPLVGTSKNDPAK